MSKQTRKYRKSRKILLSYIITIICIIILSLIAKGFEYRKESINSINEIENNRNKLKYRKRR